jgi:beta-hydroxylase
MREKMKTFLHDVQTYIEEKWPFPIGTFNLSFRDVFFTLLIVLALYVLQYAGRMVTAATLVGAVCAEPAIVALPLNVLSSVVLRTPRFWDPYVVEPRLQWVMDHITDLQSEARDVLSFGRPVPFADVSGHQARIGSPGWKVFPFFAGATTNYENCSRAPITFSLLRQIPSIRLAMYSILEENTHIPLHNGFFKHILRVHITLVAAPCTDRYIDVGGQRYTWKEGEIVAFDDTYPHKVMNTCKGKRLVLFLDVDRPTSFHATGVLVKALGKFLERSPSLKAAAALQERQHK